MSATGLACEDRLTPERCEALAVNSYVQGLIRNAVAAERLACDRVLMVLLHTMERSPQHNEDNYSGVADARDALRELWGRM